MWVKRFDVGRQTRKVRVVLSRVASPSAFPPTDLDMLPRWIPMAYCSFERNRFDLSIQINFRTSAGSWCDDVDYTQSYI